MAGSGSSSIGSGSAAFGSLLVFGGSDGEGPLGSKII